MNMQQKGRKYHGKIIVVGDGGCGKTCLLRVFQENRFPEGYVPTIVDNFAQEVLVDENSVLLSVWDTAGSEEYDSIRGLSYKDTDLVLLCFQIDRPVSLKNIVDKWAKEIQNYLPNAGKILVGLKSDTRETGTFTIPYEEGMKVSEDIAADLYIETSALENKNVQKTFEEASRWIVKNKVSVRPMKKWYFCYCC